MTLFRLDASIRTDGSASREIADIVEAEWLAVHPGDRIERRHIGVDVLPANAWANAVTAQRVTESDRTPEQQAAVKLAAELVDELLDADAILLAVPLYNFGVSQHIKTWIDLIITDPRAASGGSPSWPASRSCWPRSVGVPTAPGRRAKDGTTRPRT